MQNLHRILVVGAALGLSSQIAALLPEPKPARQQTPADIERLAAAEQRRARRRQRMIDLHQPVMDHPRPEYETLFWPDMDAYYEAEDRNREAALREVRRFVRRKVYRDILEYIKDCDCTSDFQIVTKPYGDRQSEGEYSFECAYVHQYENGGYTGDSYAGYVCIPLNAGKFLKFHYSM